jgi:hypothetical protein
MYLGIAALMTVFQVIQLKGRHASIFCRFLDSLASTTCPLSYFMAHTALVAAQEFLHAKKST